MNIGCLSVVVEARLIPDLVDDKKKFDDEKRAQTRDVHGLQYNSIEVTNLLTKAHEERIG